MEEGVGIDLVDADPKYNFLSQFSNDDDPDDFSFLSNDFSPYNEIDVKCEYIAPEDYLSNDLLSILSINIQSLPSKFDDFNDFINDLRVNNNDPDIICIQETWHISDSSLYDINGYHSLVYNIRSTARGGGCGNLY